MARILTFLDNFLFRKQITIDGQTRKIEAPQYTQEGNAAPPILGWAISRVVTLLLHKEQHQSSTTSNKSPTLQSKYLHKVSVSHNQSL
jgi:hypothetical protein